MDKYYNSSNKFCVFCKDFSIKDTIYFLLIILFLSTYSNHAFGFWCSLFDSPSVNSYHATYNVKVQLQGVGVGESVELSDVSKKYYCIGVLAADYRDMVKARSFEISQKLKDAGFTGYVMIKDKMYGSVLNPTQCVWYGTNCSLGSYVSVQEPVLGKVGLIRTKNSTTQHVDIKAGEQVGIYNLDFTSTTGQFPLTVTLLAASDVHYTNLACTMNPAHLEVEMPTVSKDALLKNGVGAYPKNKPFDIRLSCDEGTNVSIEFDGTTLSGHDDVLANSDSGNSPVGIQIQYGGSPVILGKTISNIIGHANSTESLHFTSAYYYNGGDLSVGKVNATSNLTLTYQ